MKTEGMPICGTHAFAFAMQHHALKTTDDPLPLVTGMCLLVDRGDSSRGGPRAILIDVPSDGPVVMPQGWDLSDPKIEIVPMRLAVDQDRTAVQRGEMLASQVRPRPVTLVALRVVEGGARLGGGAS